MCRVDVTDNQPVEKAANPKRTGESIEREWLFQPMCDANSGAMYPDRYVCLSVCVCVCRVDVTDDVVRRLAGGDSFGCHGQV